MSCADAPKVFLDFKLLGMPHPNFQFCMFGAFKPWPPPIAFEHADFVIFCKFVVGTGVILVFGAYLCLFVSICSFVGQKLQFTVRLVSLEVNWVLLEVNWVLLDVIWVLLEVNWVFFST